MYVKKNLMLWVAALALALPMLLAGNAYALYPGDGSKMVPAGGWDITDKGVCVTGITSAGAIQTNGAVSNPDCIATVVNSTTSSATCISFANSEGASHYWTSTCVGADGTVISLTGLDRTATMCNQRSVAQGHGAGTMTNKCVGSWTNTGVAGDGAPGFCYTTVRLNTSYPTTATCPNSNLGTGYAWSTAGCTYSYGISGTTKDAVKKKDGSTWVAANAAIDVSTLTTQGACLANGGGWSTGTAKTGTSTTAEGAVIATVPMARQGCLECHNTTSQRNGYAERWKETYLKTGHKNMLRKVTAGTNLVGPDGLVYTTDGTGAIDFAAGTYTAASGATSGIATKLFYIYGDWMAAAPSVVYNNQTTDALATNGYSCAACHTTGFSNSSAGVCSLSSKTTNATCTAAGGTWTASTGLTGEVGAEPAASYAGIKGVTGTWQKDGITCARCHNTTMPAVIDATLTTQTACEAAGNVWSKNNAGTYDCTVTGTHNISSVIVGKNVTNLCYGCHQSPAKTPAGGADVDLAHPEYIPVKNTGTAFTTANPKGWAPEFNGHVLGNSFLNSAHGKYTGTITPNKVGKYSIVDGTYASTFKGKYCRSSSAVAGGSIMKTKVNATTGAAEIIKNSADCTTAGGFWQDAGNTTYGFNGSCTTCHDVHQSIVGAVNAEEPLVKECETCHENKTDGYGAPQVEMAKINHPMTAGTPFDTTLFKNACEACHMPKATSGGFPIHLWRISTDANYSTFPSKAAFYGGSCSVSTPAAEVSTAGCTAAGGTWTATTKNLNAMTAADGAYTNATWIDVDIACGQCHGGSSTTVKNGAMYKTKAQLAAQAVWMHEGGDCTVPVANATITAAGNVVTLTDTSTGVPTSISINWGDGNSETVAAGLATPHTYSTRAATYSIMQTATNGCGSNTKIVKRAVTTTKYAVTVTVTGNTSAKVGIKKKNGTRFGTVGVGTGSTGFSVAAGDYRVACNGASQDVTVSGATAVSLVCK